MSRSPKRAARRVLGIDPGTRVVGYGIVEVVGHELRYLECGVLTVDQTDDLSDRVHELAEALAQLIQEFEPTTVAIESAFHGQNAASSLKLAEARGAFREICMQQGLSVSEYAPAAIKRAVVGRGRATKADVQTRVSLLCGLRREPAADAADGLAVALCHAQNLIGPAVAHRTARA